MKFKTPVMSRGFLFATASFFGKLRCMKHLSASLLAMTLFATASFADGVMSLGGSEWGEGQDSKVVIQFSADGKVSGNLGCNRFFGTYKQDGDKLTFGAVGNPA